MLLFDLFRTFFLIGLFSFGGGVASMELIRSRVVSDMMWMTDSEFTDIISISEMTPGPLGINIASFVGTRIAGVPGTIVTTFAYVLPAVVIVMVLAWVYFRFRKLPGIQGVLTGLHPAVAAMVFASMLKITGNALWGGLENFSLPATNFTAVVLAAVMLYLLQKKKLGPVQAILLSGAVGAVCYAFGLG